MVNYLLSKYPNHFELSISCTTRPPRGQEVHGKEYYFITPQEFRQRIQNDEFIEYEQVYEGLYYGTLKEEIRRIEEAGKQVLFDVDVKGGLNLKRILGEKATSVFICPPSIDELRKRLEGRGTDAPEVIDQRIARAEFELTFADKFDKIVVNDILEYAEADALKVIEDFLND